MKLARHQWAWSAHMLNREVGCWVDLKDWTVGVSVDVGRWVWIGLVPMAKFTIAPLECSCHIDPGGWSGTEPRDADWQWDPACTLHKSDPMEAA